MLSALVDVGALIADDAGGISSLIPKELVSGAAVAVKATASVSSSKCWLRKNNLLIPPSNFSSSLSSSTVPLPLEFTTPRDAVFRAISSTSRARFSKTISPLAISGGDGLLRMPPCPLLTLAVVGRCSHAVSWTAALSRTVGVYGVVMAEMATDAESDTAPPRLASSSQARPSVSKPAVEGSSRLSWLSSCTAMMSMFGGRFWLE
mmetsp:Transcript_6381/g.14427  ORF Transcript_6381/g.14427 Transcript_6381/m.14427 type:complete len:205 (+) Transcript_6381:2037-2651(+)